MKQQLRAQKQKIIFKILFKFNDIIFCRFMFSGFLKSKHKIFVTAKLLPQVSSHANKPLDKNVPAYWTISRKPLLALSTLRSLALNLESLSNLSSLDAGSLYSPYCCICTAVSTL